MSHRAVCWAAGDRNRGEQCLWKALPPCARKSTPWHVAHMSQHGHHHVALKLQRFGLGGGGAGVPTTFPPRSLHVPSTSQEIKQILGVTWNTDDSDRGR